MNILNEPYHFNFGGVSILVEENYKFWPVFFMPDENPEYEQDFYWQVENVAGLVEEANDSIKNHLKRAKTMVVANGGFALFPPSIALHKALWEKVDLIGFDPYVGNAAPFPWFFYKMLVEQAKRADKPIWITEWNWDASWCTNGRCPWILGEFVEKSIDYGVEGIIFFTFNSFGEPGLFALYNLKDDEIPPEKMEVYEALKEAYEKIER